MQKLSGADRDKFAGIPTGFNHVQGYIQRLGGVLCGLHGIIGHPGKMHQCGLYGKALLLSLIHIFFPTCVYLP